MCQQFVNISFNSSTIPSWPISSFLSLSGKGYKIDLKSLQRGKRRLKRWTWSRFQTPGINQWPGPSLANKISQDPGFWEVDVVLSLLQNMLETPAPSSVAADPALIPCHSHHSSTGALLPVDATSVPEPLERGWAAGKEGGCWQGLQMLKSVSNLQNQNSVIETSVGSDFTLQITPPSYQWKHCVSESLSRWFGVHKRSKKPS